MTKFFKILMNIILILFIAALCAVFIPTFLGVSVNVATGSMKSNISVGSVAYGIKESLNDINSGDKIVVSDTDSLYTYEVTEVDASNGELIVRESSDSDTTVIELRRTASKLVIVVPIIGYLFIALQSFEGVIIFALAAALIIILFIISRVVANGHDDEADEDTNEKEDDFGYFKELAASSDRPSSLDSLAAMSMTTVVDEPTTPMPTDTIPLDEEIEDLSELVLEPADGNEDHAESIESDESADKIAENVEDKTATDENSDEQTAKKPEPDEFESLMKEISEAETASAKTAVSEATSEPVEEPETESESVVASEAAVVAGAAVVAEAVSEKASEPETVSHETSEFSGIEGALEQALINNQMTQTPDDVTPAANSAESESVSEDTPTEIELAIPTHTLDELLQESYAKGEDPQVKKDPATGITLVDYSSCL